MSTAHLSDDDRHPAVLVPLVAGALLALAGGYWDDAFHTEHGRDEFLSAPHLAIYGGVSLAGGALALWVAAAVRGAGLRPALRDGPLALAALSVAVTLASGPIDNAWHVAFGRDAVIWSPPHTLGIVGMAGLACALLLVAGRSRAGFAPILRAVAGGFLVAAFAFLVVEYETDVPQFDAVWYLPVLTLGTSLAFALVVAATESPWEATRAASAHLAFVAAVALFLVALGYDAPKLPLLVVPALVADALRRRGVQPALVGIAYAAALYAVYVPSVNLIGHGVRLNGEDVIIGLPLALLAAAGVFSLVLGGRVARPRAQVAVAALAALLAPPGAALAHDPGQGDDAGAMRLAVTADERQITLRAEVEPEQCASFGLGELVARRAGETIRTALERGGCGRYAGTVEVPEDGRWFVYAEIEKSGEPVESWLPVEAGAGVDVVRADDRYAYRPPDPDSGPLKVVAGGLMYLAMLGFLVVVGALVRREAASRGAADTG